MSAATRARTSSAESASTMVLDAEGGQLLRGSARGTPRAGAAAASSVARRRRRIGGNARRALRGAQPSQDRGARLAHRSARRCRSAPELLERAARAGAFRSRHARPARGQAGRPLHPAVRARAAQERAGRPAQRRGRAPGRAAAQAKAFMPSAQGDGHGRPRSVAWSRRLEQHARDVEAHRAHVAAGAAQRAGAGQLAPLADALAGRA